MIQDKYAPKEVEEKWYRFWEEQGLFKADPTSSKPAYCIVMPPPNVTGILHMGHALVSTIQDLLIRWRRMSGDEVLWVPGSDHAGIATQAVVERQFVEKVGRKPSREELLGQIWQWKEEKERAICHQLRQLGCSCDWSRYQFTMGEWSSRAVRAFFKRLYDAGLIYRGSRLVNWDPVTQTALADDEVETVEREGSIWTVRYPLVDEEGHISVATTRPETIFGDVAIAVHPLDSRYAHSIGQTVRHPFNGEELPIIADSEVDPEFGTGAVKITPAHDPTDYQIGERHQLPLVNIMTSDGRLNDRCGSFAGKLMAEARPLVVEALKEMRLIEKIDRHHHRVGISYRSKAVIEPYLSKQWFIQMEGFRPILRELVESGKSELLPKSWNATYFHWIDNLRDWCISRQLWWGHRIPIWYRTSNPDEVICYDGEGLPPEVEREPDQWHQETDVLDTWFSSALWPFSTLGWPNATPELKKFYPNSVLVTGFDILFFWVARMLMAGEEAMGEPPFRHVYLHGLIYGRSYWRHNPDGGVSYITGAERLRYDLGEPHPPEVQSRWEKLSKSKGNVIDPSEIIDEYGTDAMRMALLASGPQNGQIDLDRRRFAEFQSFANKIWNGARFIFLNLEGVELTEGVDLSLLRLEDRWILDALAQATEGVNRALEGYLFDRAAMVAYDFYWKEFCAYYLEICKPILFGKRGTPAERLNKQKLLAIVLIGAVRLLHPMAPFITEELFQRLKERFGGVAHSKSDPFTAEALRALAQPACMVAPFPSLPPIESREEVRREFDLVQQLVYAVRNIRGEMGVAPGMATALYLIAGEKMKDHCDLIEALVRTSRIEFCTEEPSLPFSSTAMVGGIKLLVALPEELREQEVRRLEKEQLRLEQKVEQLKKRLSDPNFTERAPEALVQKSREELSLSERELDHIRSALSP